MLHSFLRLFATFRSACSAKVSSIFSTTLAFISASIRNGIVGMCVRGKKRTLEIRFVSSMHF